MIEYSEEALAGLSAVRKRDGLEQMLTIFEWCEKLDEPSTRLTAEYLGGPDELFRMRVGDYYIVFQLYESDNHEAVRITRVRVRTRSSPS
jgi:hypothetical protein